MKKKLRQKLKMLTADDFYWKKADLIIDGSFTVNESDINRAYAEKRDRMVEFVVNELKNK